MTWQEGSAWWTLAATSAGCLCTGHPSPSASTLGQGCFPSLGLSLHHSPCPSPTARQREALEPAGEALSSQGLPQGSALPRSSTQRLPKEEVSALSRCRNHQWYKKIYLRQKENDMLDFCGCALSPEEPPCPAPSCCPIPIPLLGQNLDTQHKHPKQRHSCPGQGWRPPEHILPCGTNQMIPPWSLS